MAEMAQNPRLHELEEAFAALEPKLTDEATKEAISLLHAMIHETWRTGPAAAESGWMDGGRQVSFEDVANLYKKAPRPAKPAVSTPLPPGTPAPDFTLKDQHGNEVSLSDFRGCTTVLVFYPLDWSPTCSDQLSLYQAEHEEFTRRNAEIVGVSVDSFYSHEAWAMVRGIEFPLLADFQPRGEVARRYQVMREEDGHSERALFVIDPEGIIRYSWVAPKLDQVPDIYNVYQLLDELQQTGSAAPEREVVTA